MIPTHIRRFLPEFLLVLFIIVWCLVIIADYVNKHPLYYFSYKYFRYQNLSLFILSFTGVLYLLNSKFEKVSRFLFTGSSLIVIVVIYITALCLAFSKYVPELQLELANVNQFLAINFKSLSYLFLITISAYLYGNLFKRLNLPFVDFKISVGLILLISHLFIFAAIGLLNLYSILWVLLLPIVLQIKMLPDLLSSIFIQKVDLAHLNVIGFFSISILILYLLINFTYIQTTFPLGFDSRNFYMNIARQISESESLIYGYRPYNWGLLLSTGYILFKSSAVALSVSFYGFIISLIAIHQLCVRALKIDINNTLLLLLIIAVTPAITNQLYTELKTDMGLLFFQTVSISYLLHLFKDSSFVNWIKKNEKLEHRFSLKYIVSLSVLGLIIGFGLTIKLTNLFLAVAIIVAFIWISTENFFIITSAILSALVVLYLGKIDNLSGLSQYHLSTGKFFVGLLILATIAFFIGVIKDKVKIIGTIRALSIMIIFMILPLLPWMIKSYNESKSLNPEQLLNGIKPGPDITPYSIISNHKNSN